MDQNEYTFEEVNKHIEKADLALFKPGGRYHFTAAHVNENAGDVIKKICAIYNVIRPFLVAASNIILLPVKWREALKTAISLLDSICPRG